jgi:prepilin-type N-terminal cleavage/methylation domain-containing protein
MKTKLPLSSNRRHGFSLVEMLTFVAIVGILTSIVVPMLGSTNSVAEARLRRNAQELTSAFNAANAAGLNFSVQGNMDATLAAIIQGSKPASGVFKDRFFGLRSINLEEAKLATKYLKLDGEDLLYTGASANGGGSTRNVAGVGGSRSGPTAASSGRTRTVLR